MTNWSEEEKKAFHDLMGKVCWCGRPKESAHSHCWRCYRDLPIVMQRTLYKRIGAGYIEAYRESVVWLKEQGVKEVGS